MKQSKIILASNSPRRKELLRLTGLEFIVEAADIDESLDEADPTKFVEQLSYHKAKVIFDLHDDCIVIGSDTVVVVDKIILGKPLDSEDAIRMIGLLQGKSHFVYTGVTLLSNGSNISFHEKTEVVVYSMTDEQIRNYVSTGEAMDKAGAYAIQGVFSCFVKEIHGDYNTVVGLPVSRVYHEILKLL